MDFPKVTPESVKYLDIDLNSQYNINLYKKRNNIRGGTEVLQMYFYQESEVTYDPIHTKL